MVARLLWEQDVAGSNPVIPTKEKHHCLCCGAFSLADMVADSFCAKSHKAFNRARLRDLAGHRILSFRPDNHANFDRISVISATPCVIRLCGLLYTIKAASYHVKSSYFTW